MIEIRNVTKNFGDVKAVSSLSISIQTGIVGLVGENGAGKSTLFRLISDVLTPDEGEILIDGEKNTLPNIKKNLFFLPDDPYVPLRYTINDVLSFYEIFYDIDLEQCNQLIDQLTLPRNRRVADFSKGMKRQLFIAIALSVNCQYLLLDEAFDGIDPITLETVKKGLINQSITHGKTIIIASHNIDSLTRLADRIILLYKGKLSESKDVNDLGNSLVKYQLIAPTQISINDLRNLGIDVVSLNIVGSITNIVVVDKQENEAIIREHYTPTLFEKIPLDQNELVTMELLLARSKNANEQ